MRNSLCIFAILLIIGWFIGFVVYASGKPIHILLVFAVIVDSFSLKKPLKRYVFENEGGASFISHSERDEIFLMIVVLSYIYTLTREFQINFHTNKTANEAALFALIKTPVLKVIKYLYL